MSPSPSRLRRASPITYVRCIIAAHHRGHYLRMFPKIRIETDPIWTASKRFHGHVLEVSSTFRGMFRCHKNEQVTNLTSLTKLVKNIERRNTYLSAMFWQCHTHFSKRGVLFLGIGTGESVSSGWVRPHSFLRDEFDQIRFSGMGSTKFVS